MSESDKRVFELEPGIYFGLSDYVYHNTAAMSAHGMGDFIESEALYWEKSHHNPRRKPMEPTQAMRMGTAMHKLLLEPDSFAEEYRVPLMSPMSMDDDRYIIQRQDYTNMQRMAEAIRSMPDTREYLKNGFAEVTIVWHDADTGIMLRSRHDYFRTMISIDYKTAHSISDKYIKNKLNYNSDGLQVINYFHARKAAKAMVANYFAQRDAGEDVKSCIYGRAPSEAWLREFAAETVDDVYLLYQHKEAPFVGRVVYMDDQTLDRLNGTRRKVLDRYKYLLQNYGETGWPASKGTAEEFSSIYGGINSVERA